MSNPIALLEPPTPDGLPADPLHWLESLGGATAWLVPGRDRSRTRVVTTLLHGNEPSGFVALHDWLRSGPEPAVDALCIVGNVEAARLHPAFTHRSVPGRRDLNRCFLGPFDGPGDPEAQLARALLELVNAHAPEALVDVHNNTGRNPAYAVGLEPTPEALSLTALFGSRFVRSHLVLGALLEGIRGFPAVTIEVGKSGSDEADRVARAGIERFLSAEDPLAESGAGVRVLEMPMRARLAPGVELVMAQRPDPQAGLTMPDDLDRHNFEVVEPGSRIGWVRGEAMPLALVDEEGHDRAGEYFALQGDELVVRRPFTPIMITVDAAVAASDCLFYVVHDVAVSPDA